MMPDCPAVSTKPARRQNQQQADIDVMADSFEGVMP